MEADAGGKSVHSTSRKSTMHGENIRDIKETHRKAKIKKDDNRNLVDARYGYLFMKLSQQLGISEEEVQEILISDEKFFMFKEFFKANGNKTIMFFYQHVQDLESSHPNTFRLSITDGRNQGLNGLCLFFIRTSKVAVSNSNVVQEVNFMNLDSSNGGLLSGIEMLLQDIFIPSLKAKKNWGQVSEEHSSAFIEQLSGFVNTLSTANSNILGRVVLDAADLQEQLAAMKSPSEYSAASSNSKLLESVEKLVVSWINQIEQVLAQSEQMRKEADDIGPGAELDHWRKRMAKFNSLLDQVKSAHCRSAVGILLVSRSQYLKQWRELDCRITNAANEAKDNMKYLYTLDKLFVPLVKCTPKTLATFFQTRMMRTKGLVGKNSNIDAEDKSKMVEHINSLMHGIQMIHSISQYYNTSERMTSLFVKITNQMITTCKGHVRKDAALLWDLPKEVISFRIHECIRLNKEYQKSFQKTKTRLKENPSERQFEFSENYIFGKFDAFCKRLEKLDEMLNTVSDLSSLRQVKVEGMDGIIKRYEDLVSQIKKKTYDILDHRKSDFDNDFDEFKLTVDSIKEDMQSFLDSWFEKPLTTMQSLELLEKFKKISGMDLYLNDKYHRVLVNFAKDIEQIKKNYQKHRLNPPLTRNVPPISGKIAWSRQLYRRIANPMHILTECEDLLKTAEAKKVVKSYNKMARVLIEFEYVYHKSWMGSAENVRIGLNASLLVLHPQTKEFFVNFDPMIMELIQEAKSMEKMSLEIPEPAKLLMLRELQIKSLHINLCNAVQRFTDLKQQIPEIVVPLMQPLLRKVEGVFQPGLCMLTWLSLNTKAYLEVVNKSLEELEMFVKEVGDLLECGITTNLDNISNALICVTDNRVMELTEFLSETQLLCTANAKSLTLCCELVELHTFSLIEMFKKRLSAKQLQQLGTGNQYPCLVPDSARAKGNKGHRCWECSPCVYWNLLVHFNTRCCDAVVECVRSSLEFLRKKMQPVSRYVAENADMCTAAFFSADIILQIPEVVMKESLESIQQCVNSAVQMVLNTVRHIHQWKQHSQFHATTQVVEDTKGGEAKSLCKIVTEHKDVMKTVSMLGSVVSSCKVDATKLLDSLAPFKQLWTQDPEIKVSRFLEEKPTLSDFDSIFVHYKSLEKDVEELPERYLIGPVVYRTAMLKVAFNAEIQTCKQTYGKALAYRSQTEMEEIFEFIDNMNKRLARPVNDIDDVRSSMAALNDIREAEIRIEMAIIPIEESYALLNSHQLHYSSADAEKVDSLTYSWKKLQDMASGVQEHLLEIQPAFKLNLLSGVKSFKYQVQNFHQDYTEGGPMVEGIAPSEASQRLVVFQLQFHDLWRKYETFSGGEDLFGIQPTEYTELQQVKRELGLLHKLYNLYNTVIDTVNGYYEILWSDINIEKISSELQEMQNRIKKLPKGLKTWPAFIELKKKIDDFSECCPLLEMMAHRAMQERHWQRISTATNFPLNVTAAEGFTLDHLMQAPLLTYKEDIEDICISAIKERDIEAKLKQVICDWSTNELSFSVFKFRGELLLRGVETSEVISLMEDSLMVLGSLLSNRYNTPFKADIQKWISNLSGTTEIVENWLSVQNLWVYLEAVFVGGDIAKQLPQEAKRFSQIDKSWVKIMNRAHDNRNVVTCCVGDETLAQLLPHLLEQLEMCQKSLSGYLEKKRLVFPRFFFVSDPALLEILGQASDPHTIQAHLLGVFDNVKSVAFDTVQYDKILSVSSREGESMELQNPVFAFGNVEVWLGGLLNETKSSLHTVIREANSAILQLNFQVVQFLNQFPAQVGLLGIQMLWTREAELALTKSKTEKKIMNQTNEYFLSLLNKLIELTTHDLTSVQRVKFETLVTIHVHQRDIFDDLVKQHVKSATDFEWLKQSRFYFREESDKCQVCITDVTFEYQNEFMGCTDRLVITPLTDRCYITLAQALHMSLGGAPAGPAGTGKTETVKDMGKALGKYVVVFNCSDQMDYRGLGRIYKGLAQSGSWGCFDEFNRIELPVLSVAAQQIYIVLCAKKERKQKFIFTDGDHVKLDPEFGLFLTMNPGYAGRQELPENLKIQFRTVAMMVPDRQIIMRVKFAACGFQQNIMLARKFFTLYKLCDEQLSAQVHYDFGLRNILSVLRTLGAAKRSKLNDSEEKIVMRVLRDMNLSKLVDEDEPLFISLINDLFPGVQLEQAGYEKVEGAIRECVQQAKLIYHPPWVLKLIQLYETQLVRHGMMVLGPSGSGKTSCIQTLMRAMSMCFAPHREMRMNPKAITAPQMFGKLNSATNDWTDGIFSALWRKTLKSKKAEHIWMVLDGPVDTIWIENLNSVLDDNKTLTLANGDRIPMAPNCKIMFEPHNIDNASPATVSRNGMVYMSSSGLDWKPIFKGCLLNFAEYQVEILLPLFEQVFSDLQMFVEQNLQPKMHIMECNQIKQAVNILQGVLPPPQDTNNNLSGIHLKRQFLFSIMWSVGAVLELNDRTKLEAYIREKFATVLDLPQKSGENTIFEYYVDEQGQWKHWDQKVEDYVYPVDTIPEFDSILVPNVDNTRTNFLVHTIAKQEKAVLLIGEQGTAKTVILKNYCSHYSPEEHLYKSLSFSSATKPVMFQKSLESYVDKRIGNTYGPPAGRKMTVFVDDINMPVINEWGDQITNEIVRQLMESKGFYNLEKPGDFTNIADIQLVAAMIHPGGGRNDIPERLKRQFTVFNCTLPSDASIDKIFRTIGTGYFSVAHGFCEDVCDLVPSLVVATRKLWQQTKLKLLATPSKFHYIFNLRDLSRIWKGMLNLSEARDRGTMLNVWKHECLRVIADRFIACADTDWFTQTMHTCAQQEFSEQDVPLLHEEPYFVDFLRDAPEITGDEPDDVDIEVPKVYEQIESLESLNDRLIFYLHQYNENVRGLALDLVFFKDAITHLVKISRILRTKRGNALLVGVGGSGKQSLTRLASYIAGYTTFQITLTRSYNTSNLLEDLKVLYRTAGLEGKGVTFLFTDNDVKDEGFLEYLNNVLASGEVSNLFTREEIDEIGQELIPVMKKELPRVRPTNENLFDYFIARVKNNLHVVLCFSPVGEKFRNRSLKFPGLISGCTMDWFAPWPGDALVEVAQHFLNSYNIMCQPSVKQSVVHTMGIFHDSVSEACTLYFERFRRHAHVTPKSYLSFISSYKEIYSEKYQEINMLSERMNIGLAKLVEASQSVVQLSKELVEKEKELSTASAKADVVLKEVTASAQAAEVVKAEVSKVKDKAQNIVDAISVDKAIALNKLEVARPALEEAEAALNTIKPTHIQSIRKLLKPPHLIMRIMDCILILFKSRIDPVTYDPEKNSIRPSWGESLRFMSQSGFLQSLMTFQKDTINEEIVELLEPYLTADDYNLDSARKACGDVAGLLAWTKAMSYFFSINKEVLPLKSNLIVQEARLETAQDDLRQAEMELDYKQKELDAAQRKFDEAMREKQTLLDDADTCRQKMTNAKALIDGLAGERHRWTEQSKLFDEQKDKLVGDVLLATSFLSYSGPFNQEFRAYLIKSCKKEMRRALIPFNEDLNITNLMVSQATISEWNLQGLPNDELSLQNGIIVTKASRYPLLVDPQGQGKAWIKTKEQGELSVTTLNHKYFRSHLEDALSLGRPLLLEDIEEELDPALDNVLEKNFIKSGKSLKVKVGDKEVDVMSGFRFYLTTKLPNPSYTPEINAKTSVIDFTVTMKGLEDQLLGRVILKEKQELENERVSLMEEVAANKLKMKDLEDNLLSRLTSTQGSLVDDDTLVAVLRTTKHTSEEVSEKLSVAAETETKINSAREEYRPVATRGSILYFLIVEMSYVNVMYQTSLRQFLSLFDLSLDKSNRSPIPSKRIQNIVDYLTTIVFNYTMRGLFEQHKFLFTLLLALKIDIHKKLIKQEEFEVFVKGGAALDLNAVVLKPKRWIQDLTWLNLVALSNLNQFSQIVDQIGSNDKSWKAWFDSDQPEETVMPDGYEGSLDTFRKLLLVRAWCPDRTINQARKYITSSIGPKFAEGVLLNMESMWEESSPSTPMVCLLSMGSDPTSAIELLAKRKGFGCKSVSMGQGQEIHARRLLHKSTMEGGWVLLQNCHLGLNFMDELFTTMTALENVHENFRLWLTTEVHQKFPISLLQVAIKYTNEPPQGVRDGLTRTYAGITQDQLDIINLAQWKPLLYATAFLHTVVQERRKFGPLGWNIPYEFNSSDLSSSIQFVQNHLDELDFKKGISWPTLRYMLGEVQYGGRVTDEIDKRLLNTFCRAWFHEKMFGEGFEFHHGYTIPRCQQLTEVMQHIQNLPMIDSPEVFGLHPNADITYQTKAAVDILDTILNIQPKDSGGNAGETREARVAGLAGEMLNKLPPDYNIHEVKSCLQRMGALVPMHIFLRQEMDRMQVVLSCVRSTLTDLQLAIDGTIIMSDKLRDALDKIYDARVPLLWRKISWKSTTLGFWFTELLDRNKQLSDWLFNGRPNCYWMTGFFNPQGFLTAMRQEITRAHKGWALDGVVLSNDVTKFLKEDITSPPDEGVYIYGLYLDGAGWDKRNCRLAETPPKVLFTQLPVVHVYAVNAQLVRDARLYECPVYKRPQRTDLNFVFSLNLRSALPPDHWTLRGVALLCDIK